MRERDLIDRYSAGAELLAKAVANMTNEQLDAKPVAGRWSTRQVVCHIADFEPIYADRIKRIIAEDRPTFFGGDPDRFATFLKYERRDVSTELEMISAVRRHLCSILRELSTGDFQREGIHSEDGPVTLMTLLSRVTDHVPHHVRFIEEKRRALGC